MTGVTLFREPAIDKPRKIILTWLNGQIASQTIKLPARHTILSCQYVPDGPGRAAHYRLEYETEISGETYSNPKEQVTVEFVCRYAHSEIAPEFRHIVSNPVTGTTMHSHMYARLVPSD